MSGDGIWGELAACGWFSREVAGVVVLCLAASLLLLRGQAVPGGWLGTAALMALGWLLFCEARFPVWWATGCFPGHPVAVDIACSALYLWVPVALGVFSTGGWLMASFSRGKQTGWRRVVTVVVRNRPRDSRMFYRHRVFPLLLVMLWLSGLVGGGLNVLAQSSSSGGNPPAGTAPPSGTPSTGTPAGGSPQTPRSGRRGPRRSKSRKADKLQIKALSMVGFLGQSIQYIRKQMGPAIITEVRRLHPAFVALGYGLLAIISLFTLWRMASESDDASMIPAFIGRMIVCGVLIAMSSYIVQTLFQIGFFWTASGTIEDMVGATRISAPGGGFSMDANPPPVDNDTVNITATDFARLNVIDEWRRRSKDRFLDGLEQFRRTKLKVRITQSEFFDPQSSGLEYFIPDFSRAGKEGFVHQFLVGLNPKSWSPLQLYSALDASILVMQIGIFTGWVLLVFLLPFCEILSPVFFSVAVDKGKLFDQMTMPFVRGLLTASLIMPLVNIILEGIAYNIASLGFAVFDTQDGKKGVEVFQWDASVEQIVAASDPTVLVFTSCFFILVSGLSLILSPVIAYRIMSGELFGAAVGAISGWTAGLVSLGISAVSQGVGASFQRQAEHISNIGNYQSSAASASGSAQAARLRNQSEYTQTLNQIRESVQQSFMKPWSPAMGMGIMPWAAGTANTFLGLARENILGAIPYVGSYFGTSQQFSPHSSHYQPNENLSHEQRRDIIERYPGYRYRYVQNPDGSWAIHAARTKVFKGDKVVTVHEPVSPNELPSSLRDQLYTLASPFPAPGSSIKPHASLLEAASQAGYHNMLPFGVVPGYHLPEVALKNPVEYHGAAGGGYTLVEAQETSVRVNRDDFRTIQDLSRDLYLDPRKQQFAIKVKDQDVVLSREQAQEIVHGFASGRPADLQIYFPKGQFQSLPQDALDRQRISEMVARMHLAQYFGDPYTAGVQLYTTQNLAQTQIMTAQEVRALQDKAADAEYAGQIAAAQAVFDASNKASALRHTGTVVTTLANTFERVLAGQIEQNRV